ncbi:MAG: DUF2798 domain-containing protein [Phycisphaeraceae bacterium]|nr:DUF2798 domain-containing protein [Phycisphaeraceae bacterium]
MQARNGLVQFVFIVLMSIVMSAVMSGAMTWVNFGLSEHFWPKFLKGFLVGLIVSTPTGLVIASPLRRLAENLVVRRKEG